VDVALKIWRYDSSTGERALREYEVDAPEEATLLDVLDIVKDRVDGTLAYRKSCRMMICGSCGMRMDGGAVLACKTRMQPIVESGHVPVISAMGNLPIVKDLVVDMEPFWSKFRAIGPWLNAGYDQPNDGKEYRIEQQRMNYIHKEALCINCGCCVSECNAMESDPEFLGPQALAKGMRFVGDPRDATTVERLERYNGEHGIWECTRCYFCNERCPKGVDPRDAIAKLGAESVKLGIDQDLGAKHAKWFVRSAYTTGWLRETELVPKTQGIVSAIKQTGFAIGLAKHGKVPPPVPPHVAERVNEARALYNLVKNQRIEGAAGIVQGERALARLEHGYEDGRDPYGEGSFPRPFVADEKGQTEQGGANEGMGSRTQADVTPGQEPTRKPGGGA
jgi:succinate dehydrogenase / fumarate reductase iron-sulfur subunit